MAKKHKAMRKFLEEMGLKVLHQNGKVHTKTVRVCNWGMFTEIWYGDGSKSFHEERQDLSGIFSTLCEAFNYVRDIRFHTRKKGDVQWIDR